MYQYTNGFDLSLVSSALTGRLGWIQPTAQGAPTLDQANTASKSGRYYNDGSFHSMVTVSNIVASQENAKLDEAGVNALLVQKGKAAAMRALTAVFNEVEYFDGQMLLYDRLPENAVPVQNSGLAVGYQLDLTSRIDITCQITTAILFFDSDVTFNLYLFKEGTPSPIWTKEVEAKAGEQTVIDISDIYLNYAALKGGRFYLVYFQDDLGTAKAIQEQICGWNRTHCIGAQAFTAPRIGSSFSKDNRSFPMAPYGLNLEVTSFRDWTQDIVKKANYFDNLIGLTMAYMVIEESLYTNRSNATERNNKDDLQTAGLQLDLKGAAPVSASPKIQGLQSRIDQEAVRVKKQFIKKQLPATINISTTCPYS